MSQDATMFELLWSLINYYIQLFATFLYAVTHEVTLPSPSPPPTYVYFLLEWDTTYVYVYWNGILLMFMFYWNGVSPYRVWQATSCQLIKAKLIARLDPASV